jgi:hypothetical protein
MLNQDHDDDIYLLVNTLSCGSSLEAALSYKFSSRRGACLSL